MNYRAEDYNAAKKVFVKRWKGYGLAKLIIIDALLAAQENTTKKGNENE